MKALKSHSPELLCFSKGMRWPDYGLFDLLGCLFQWQCKVIRNSLKTTFFKNIYIYLLNIPTSRSLMKRRHERQDCNRIIFLICTTSGWFGCSGTAQAEWKWLLENRDVEFPPLLTAQLEGDVMDKFQTAKGMEMQCHNACHKKGFVSHPLSGQPKAQQCAGIGLAFKCTVLYLRPQGEERVKRSSWELLGRALVRSCTNRQHCLSPSCASFPPRSIQCQK